MAYALRGVLGVNWGGSDGNEIELIIYMAEGGRSSSMHGKVGGGNRT